jgi:1-deoxy-D-xylulose-5-phosphate reductoisomerase
MRKRVIVVGATGSIGSQALDVIESRPDLFEVAGLSAHEDVAGLSAAGARHPGVPLCLSGAASPSQGIPLAGSSGLDELVGNVEADIVVNGASGSGGLRPSIVALSSGKDLALANKESVVMAWPLLEATARERKARILPVDSEHAALFQLVARIGGGSGGPRGIEELVITASGGAFRDWSLARLKYARPDEAASHPNWSMGRKITIDSATMANKGLEVIEASRLFGFEPERVRVLIHPQSLVHALVRTLDGSLYAQVSSPDMRLPIQNALTWPETQPCRFGRLDLAGRSLEFRSPEAERYPLLGLAYEALAGGEGATIAYNAADEVGVAAFEAGRVSYVDIARVVAKTLELAWPSRVRDLGSIFEVDGGARVAAEAAVGEIECI